jgi:tRNA threonylcarbamoyladenosine biosynthesis protein TsaB
VNGTNSGKMEGGCTALALDTSSAVLATAITRNGSVWDSSQSFTERNHSVRVVSDLRELMARAGLRREQIDFIAVGRGPGSYTGVRIAVTAAKTLAWAWQKPLVGVSSLEAMAFGAWHQWTGRPDTERSAWIVPVMDARRGQVYTSLFAANRDGKWARAEADGIRPLAAWCDSLRELAANADDSERPQAVYFVGESSFLEGKREAIAAGAGTIPFRTEAFAIEAGAVGLLAERKFRRGERDDIHGFVPNYTQLTEAEVNLMKARTEIAK